MFFKTKIRLEGFTLYVKIDGKKLICDLREKIITE